MYLFIIWNYFAQLEDMTIIMRMLGLLFELQFHS